MNFTRRQTLKILVGSGVTLYLQPFKTGISWASEATNNVDFSPIDRTLPDVAPRVFFGDQPDTAHQILWIKSDWVKIPGNLPAPTEKAPLVIVGGGIAGLFTAYLLRKHNPIVLEQAARFGGNAKGQSWRGVDYSIGAAYFIEPEFDGEIQKLCNELGLEELWRLKSDEDPVEINKKVFRQFWSGETVADDPKAKAQFEKLLAYFEKVNEGEEIPYPDIPITDPEQTENIRTLDRISFKKHVESIVGGRLHRHIEAALEHYCWSSFGASSAEVSAASGLNFYAAEFGNLAICPGGNSAVAERVVQKLAEELPAGNLRPGCLVYDIRLQGEKVNVTYQDAAGKKTTIQAEAVVAACPKFVVSKILEGIEPARVEAIKRIKYRSYFVANVCLKSSVADPFYDLYLLGDGHVDTDKVKDSAVEQRVTDVIVANYAKAAGAENTVLTLYRGFPYDDMRKEILAPQAYKYYRESFEQQIKGQILPLMGIKTEDIVDLRIARWGHPLPVAAIGAIADGTVEQLRKPFGNRVFFVEQDNWLLPAFETSVTEAITWAGEIDKLLSPDTTTAEAVSSSSTTSAVAM